MSCATTPTRCAKERAATATFSCACSIAPPCSRRLSVPIDIVFGHNDLLAANILDDGRRLWLLDWDYAGFNSPLFDLGGLASNSEMPRDLSEALLASYFGRPVDAGLRYRAGAMTAASLLRETMWSMVSEIHSSVNFDYAAYTAENLARFEAAYTAFENLERS